MFGLIGGAISGLLGGGGGGGIIGGLLGGLTKSGGGIGGLLEGILGKDNPFSKLFSAMNPSEDVLKNVTGMLSNILNGGGEK